MVSRWGGWTLQAAGALALAGYAVLAIRAEDVEARPWLAMALVLGWVALAAAVWRQHSGDGPRWVIVGWALLFRGVGIGVAPSWEDDYHRYLWDGYQTTVSGNPYAAPPAEFFGPGETWPEPVAAALDGINHPEIATIYGPAAQGVFGLAALVAPGRLEVLKLLLLLIEIAGWWSLRRVLGWRGWVLVWWCPLAVTEIAFAGHSEAVGVAALAWAMAAWGRGWGARAGLAAGLALAGKAFGAVMIPFVAGRFGGRGLMFALLGSGALYMPFWLQGSTAEWPAVRIMSQTFEYNSTGFALVKFVLPDAQARLVSGLITLVGAAWIWWCWMRGDRAVWPPAAAVLGWILLWSPVVNPWYALWLLPLVAVRPAPWAVGVLVAVPLAYTHGGSGAVGAGVDYAHAIWTRPLELLVVLVAWGAGRCWRRTNPLSRNT